MKTDLRPMNLGEILDRTAQLYRSHFLVFLGISVIPTGATLVLAFVFEVVADWWSWRGVFTVFSEIRNVLVGFFGVAVVLVALPVLLAATALAAAAMNHAVSCIYLGETATIRDAYKTVWQRGWRYTGLYLLEVLFIAVFPMVLGCLIPWLYVGVALLGKRIGISQFFLDAPIYSIVLLVPITVVSIVIWMLLRLSLAFPACVVEQSGAWPAFKRSWTLSKGTKGCIFVLYLLVGILGWGLLIGVAVPLTILMALIPGLKGAQHAQAAGVALLFVTYIASYIVQVLIKPIYGIALVFIYYDQRIRKEGYDIERMMEDAGMNASVTAPVEAKVVQA